MALIQGWGGLGGGWCLKVGICCTLSILDMKWPGSSSSSPFWSRGSLFSKMQMRSCRMSRICPTTYSLPAWRRYTNTRMQPVNNTCRTCHERPLWWETTVMRDHPSWKTRWSRQKVRHVCTFQYNLTCQRLPVQRPYLYGRWYGLSRQVLLKHNTYSMLPMAMITIYQKNT